MLQRRRSKVLDLSQKNNAFQVSGVNKDLFILCILIDSFFCTTCGTQSLSYILLHHAAWESGGVKLQVLHQITELACIKKKWKCKKLGKENAENVDPAVMYGICCNHRFCGARRGRNA